MKTSDLFVRCLDREGVEHVFGVPGEETEDLLFSLQDSEITFVPVRHEQGAAFMANVHGRLTGEAGVCLGTLGPGSTNLLTGVADANLDKAPLVAITGQGGLERLHKESHQALDVVDMFEPITSGTHSSTIPTSSLNPSGRRSRSPSTRSPVRPTSSSPRTSQGRRRIPPRWRLVSASDPDHRTRNCSTGFSRSSRRPPAHCASPETG